MTESTAAESYQAFESLRNRFGGAKKPAGVDAHAHQGKAAKQKPRRFDPRANAPPLVPLLEEGDQVQETLFRESAATQYSELGTLAPVKGKWKQGSSIKSNHLNVPDFDALETASTASYSSAYSSKSESLSPTVGSVTELSDAGSVDSFLEYDISVKKQSKTSTLRATSERPRSENAQIIRGGGQSDADVPDDYVHGCTKAWNKVIGRWVFEGIPQTYSPSLARTRCPSNEIRIPTPLGSLENLAFGGSRTSLLGSCDSYTSLQDEGSCTSLLSSNFDESEEDSVWNQKAKYKLGKFCHGHRKSPVIAHTSYKMSSPSSCSELDSRLALLDERKDTVTGNKSTETRALPAETQHAQIDVLEDGSQVSLSSIKKDGEEQVTLAGYKLGKFCSDQHANHSSVSVSHELGSNITTSSKSRDTPANSPSTKTKALGRSLSETQVLSNGTEPGNQTESGPRYGLLSSSKVWLEAQRKYNRLREHSQSPKSPREERVSDDASRLSSEEPAFCSTVEQRAKLFGGTNLKRCGLRRTKSLHIGAHKRAANRTSRRN